MMLVPGARVHIVGVGGAGMSVLAVLLAGMGCDVSGCDASDSPVLAQLRGFGVEVASSHEAVHVASSDLVLWSPAIHEDHRELVAARAAHVAMLSRAQVLGELSSLARVIGVTGTHGKTTATSMLVTIMSTAGRDDSRLVGAPVRDVGFGGYHGEGDLIVEVDESYGAFSQISPYALGLLNVEADHLDHYGSLDHLEAAFVDVMNRTSGPVVVWSDDPGAARVAAGLGRDWISVGFSDRASWRWHDVELSERGARARLVGPGESPLEVPIDLRVTGRHNLANAGVAAVLALSVGVDPADVVAGLARFRGAPRRFEHLGTWGSIDVVDDYAHLPGEIAATVEAARSAGYERIVAVFQPHRITRTQNVGDAFAPAFDQVDTVIVTDIYSAGEANPEGLTGEVVADYVRARGLTNAHYAASLADAAEALGTLGDGADLVLILGAGDVTRVLDHLAPLQRDPASTLTSATTRFLGEGRQVGYDVPLGPRTTYRVGGSVAALVTVASDQDLDEISDRLTHDDRPHIVFGNGSNLLVADGWLDLVAVHLEGEFSRLSLRDDGDEVVVVAGAGLDLPVAARRLAGEGVTGFEWAVGVPGTFGGAVAMNAGGHGSDMKASVRRVEVWSRGERRWREADELAFAYRTSALGPEDIVTRVELTLRRGDAQASRSTISEIVRWRREHQPGGANAGSVFRNPEGDSAGRLIEAAGLKGYRLGTAHVSDKHANFIIADAQGRANDVMSLMVHVRNVVGESSGVWLETEHRLVGFKEPW